MERAADPGATPSRPPGRGAGRARRGRAGAGPGAGRLWPGSQQRRLGRRNDAGGRRRLPAHRPSPLPLPGQGRSRLQPWKLAIALWQTLGLGPLPPHLAEQAGAAMLEKQIAMRRDCQDSTSLGRWFGAIAGLTRQCGVETFESKPRNGWKRWRKSWTRWPTAGPPRPICWI